jgi:ABC-type multidrug transport system ATPase subunit
MREMQQDQSPIIEVAHLTKQYKDLRAVDDLSFSVPRGQVYGFLGQNGAGKSTTMRMLLTLIRPTAGRIHLFGQSLDEHRSAILRRTGAIIEKPDLYTYLTAFQNLQIFARLSGVKPSPDQLLQQLETVGIAGRAHSKVKTFSQGMKQRLGIACALVHNPELLILDEPTNGLDPQGITDVRNLILHLSRHQGKTVLVSSHLLSEIELIADSMLIIDRGRKVAEGAVGALLNPEDTMVEVQTTDNAAAFGLLRQSAWADCLQEGDEPIRLRMSKAKIPELAAYLVGNRIGIVSLQPRHSLEDYFLSLTSSNQHVAAYQD